MRRRAAYASQRVPLWVRRQRSGPPEVLVVDDDLPIASMVADLMREHGYQVTVAHGGPEALAHLNSQPYDLVLTDLMMPVLNGFELARLVSVWDGRPPIVALTAYPVPARAAAEAGVEAIIHKPFEIAELLRVADQLTGYRGLTGAAA